MTAPAVSERRPTLTALSGVRAIAAYAVIATHVSFESGTAVGNGAFAPLLARLNYGVTLFFLLSGFLLSRQFLSDSHRLSLSGVAKFWWRRALRVLPAYWLAITGTLAFLTTTHATAKDWASYLGLVQTYNAVYTSKSLSLSQTWTLVVEVSFYVALPVLIWASRRIPRPRHQQIGILVIVMAAMALADNLLVHGLLSDSSRSLLWLPAYLDWFALGILLASLAVESTASWWRRMLADWARAAGTCWIVGALFFWLATLPITGSRGFVSPSEWQWTLQHLLFGLSAFFILLPLTQGGTPWTDALLGNRFMVWLGEISYGVYLWHLGLLLAIDRWLGWKVFGGHFWELLALAMLSATAAASTSWYVVERPLLRRFSSSWRPATRAKAPLEDGPDSDEAQHLRTSAAGQRVG